MARRTIPSPLRRWVNERAELIIYYVFVGLVVILSPLSVIGEYLARAYEYMHKRPGDYRVIITEGHRRRV